MGDETSTPGAAVGAVANPGGMATGLASTDQRLGSIGGLVLSPLSAASICFLASSNGIPGPAGVGPAGLCGLGASGELAGTGTPGVGLIKLPSPSPTPSPIALAVLPGAGMKAPGRFGSS
ncbi:Uncharacterised protein [Mycobacteroides abscessus subsp. abscessus]|nr:Uncharacterised protein [Mycobacteroides abscessus subsp. abscessus]